MKMKTLILSICLILSLNHVEYSYCAANLVIKSTSFDDFLVALKDVKVHEIKMSEEMAFEVMSHSVEQLVKYNYTIGSVMAQDISQHLTNVYTGSWLVTISSGNISSSTKHVHKDPYIKFAFKLDTFEIEKEMNTKGSICGKTQADLLREAAGKPVVIEAKEGKQHESDVIHTMTKIGTMLSEKRIKDFKIFSRELVDWFVNKHLWHHSVDVGVNHFYESHTELYTQFKPTMSYAIYQVGDLKIVVRRIDLRHGQLSHANSTAPSTLSI